MTIHRILKGIRAKIFEATILFVDFSKAFHSIRKVRSPDGDTDNFDIEAGGLQGDTFSPYLFIIWLDYLVRTSIDLRKENGFKLAKEISRIYPAQTITDVDYADDIALLANTPAQADTQLLSLERVAGGICL